MALDNVHTTLGAIEIGCLFTVFLFGVLCTQVYAYSESFRKTSYFINVAVRQHRPDGHSITFLTFDIAGDPCLVGQLRFAGLSRCSSAQVLGPRADHLRRTHDVYRHHYLACPPEGCR